MEIAAALIDKKGRNSVPLRKKKKSIGLSLERRTDGPYYPAGSRATEKVNTQGSLADVL